MARYYTVVLLVNVLFVGIVYLKARSFGMSSRSYLILTGLSVFVGMLFPLIYGHLNIFAALVLTVAITGIGAFCIVGLGYDDRGAESTCDIAAELALPAFPEEAEMQVAVATQEPGETSADRGELQIPGPAVAPVYNDNSGPAEELDHLENLNEETGDLKEAEERDITEDLEEIEESETTEDLDEAEENDITEDLEEAEENDLTEDLDEAEESDITEDLEEAEESDMTVDLEEADDKQPESETVEETDLAILYIDSGFAAKAEGRLDAAVKYFFAALEVNPPIDLELMLLLDICAMLSELGQYEKAASTLAEFENKRSAGMSPEMARELRVNRKQIETLHEMLCRANTPGLPFSRVPALIKVSVEEKVNQWKVSLL